MKMKNIHSSATLACWPRPTGLERATSGVTGRRSRVLRQESIYRAWDNSLNRVVCGRRTATLRVTLRVRPTRKGAHGFLCGTHPLSRGTFVFCIAPRLSRRANAVLIGGALRLRRRKVPGRSVYGIEGSGYANRFPDSCAFLVAARVPRERRRLRRGDHSRP